MGQTTRSAPASPWRKAHEAVRIIKLKCERGGNGMRRFKAYCITEKGGISKEANVSAVDIEMNCAGWHDFKTMPTDQEFEFPADDRPKAIINYKAGDNHTLTDIQPDTLHYLDVFRESLVESGVYAGNYTPKARKSISDCPTLVDAIVWTKQYIEEKQKVTEKAADPTVLNEALGRAKGEPPADEAPFPHELDPKKAQHAIPNHMQKTYGEKDNVGIRIRAIFGKSIDVWLKENAMNTRKAWDMVLDYEAKNLAGNNVEAKTTQNAPKINETPTLPPTAHEPTQTTQTEPQSAASQSDDTVIQEAQFVDSTPKDVTKSDTEPVEIVDDKPKYAVLVPTPIMTEATTLTGVPVGQIAEFLNRPYKANSPNDDPYRQIQGPGGKKWTDLKGNYVRDRFDKVFGPHGIGWKIAPHPTLSKITCTPSTEKTSSGERAGFLCVMENYIFQYSIVVNGSLMWVDGSVLSDADFNADMGYAYRSAWTRIMKQALRSFGGFNHFIGKAG